MVDDVVLNGFGKKLGATGIAFYITLCRYANKNTQTCWPSLTTIGKETGMHRGTIIKVAKKAERLGLIEKKVKEGRYTIYTLLEPSSKLDQSKIRTGLKLELDQSNSDYTGLILEPKRMKITNGDEMNEDIRLLSQPSEFSLKRKEIKFSKQDYDKVLEVYQKLRDITLQGKEFDPVMQDIKTMLMSKRKIEDIIGCMQWLANGDEDWKENWTIKTVRLKLPFYLKGKKQLTYKKY